MNVHLGEHFEIMVRKLVDSGRYNSASEVAREALRLLEQKEELRRLEIDGLREAIRIGRASGPSIPAEQVFDELRAQQERLLTESR